MKDTYYITSECITTQIVPMDDHSGMDSQTDGAYGGQIQVDVIETVFQVRSNPNGKSLTPQDFNDMVQKPDQNISDDPLEMTISPAKTSALPQISGDPGDKNTNESDLSKEIPLTPSKITAHSPKTSGDHGAGASSVLKKGGKMLMQIDRDFDTNVAISENGNKMVIKDWKEIVSCYKVIDEANGTKEEKPTILVDRHHIEQTVTFADNTQETLILMKEIVTYPSNPSSGVDVPTKEHFDDSIAQSSDPKNLELVRKKSRLGTDVSEQVHAENVTIETSEILVDKTQLVKLEKGMEEVVIIETFDVVVELREHPNLIENLGPKMGEMPGLRNGVPDNDTKMGKKEVQEFVTIETTEVVVEVEEYQPSSPNRFGNLGPKGSAISNVKMPKVKSEYHPMKHTNSSGNLGSKAEMPNTVETLTVDISEYVIQRIQQ